MLSAAASRTINRHRDDAVVVSTMSTIFSFAQEFPHPLNIRCAPLMGGASSIGLGVALAQPSRRVLVLDGDGSLLMQLGSLATIAGAGPHNLYHFVFDNGLLYEGGGRVPVANSTRVDFTGLALAAGYRSALSLESAEALDATLPSIFATPGPVLIRLEIEPPPTPRWSAENPHGELPDWWFTMMGDDARQTRTALRA